MVMVPDPATFRVLPWSPRTGWLLCDLVFRGGAPVPLSTRALYRAQLARLERAGYAFVAGLEVELHLFELTGERLELADAGQPGEPPEVRLLTQGYQYLTELRYDRLDPILDAIRAALLALGLPLRSMELEYGPSQIELTFAPRTGLEPADMMVLLRSAVKQLCRRRGYHATFMCRPRIPSAMSSGWHLHQSLRDLRTGANAFASAGAAGGGAASKALRTACCRRSPGTTWAACSPTPRRPRRSPRPRSTATGATGPPRSRPSARRGPWTTAA